MPRTRPSPARQPSLREHNLALVLGEVAAAGPASRARIASATGLTKATVSTLVDTLVVAGLLRESGTPAPAGVGRPGQALALGPAPVGLGLEVNVDYLAACTVDLAGEVRRRDLVAEDLRGLGADAALTRAAAVLRAALDDVTVAGFELAGVCIAVPGLVDARAGLLRVAPNLGWRDVAVVDELRARAGLPAECAVLLDNEANLAALGELWAGRHLRASGRPLESFLHVSGEIGIGAAMVLDGAVFAGTRGFAGELGHLPLDTDGPSCRCGSRGCLEQYAGQEAILRAAGLDQEARTSAGRPDGPVEELRRRADAGDPATLASLDDAGRALGIGVSVAVNLMDVDTVVLGGIYERLAAWLVPAVRRQLDARVLSAAWSPVQLAVGALGAEAAVRGAALRAVRRVIDDPAAWIAARTA